MCVKIKCQQCQLWTWKGCGQHVQQVLAGIPGQQLCQCRK